MSSLQDPAFRAKCVLEDGDTREIESATDEFPSGLEYGDSDIETLTFTNVRPGTKLEWLADVVTPQVVLSFENEVTEIPKVVWDLSRLEWLTLGDARITEIPPEIGRLTALTYLGLGNSPIAYLPAEIGRLSRLEELDMGGCRLRELPPEIGDLPSLKRLDLRDNLLTELPDELAGLPDSIDLKLDGNPLRQPYAQMLEHGHEGLFLYLRSLKADGVPQYEAKVMLVGEGNVGKTSLAAALHGDAFKEGRPTTHGIERSTLTLPHPTMDSDIRLNLWDFGGQEVYRVGHQFFYSPRSLYLLVWRPREGREENAIEDWIRRVRLRVGDEARILIVATYGEERHAELDYPALKLKFPEIVVGHHVVDNSTGLGVEEVRRAVAEHAARLPQMGELLSTSWAAARDEILGREAAQIPRHEFADICAAHGLAADETGVLATLLHDLGYTIHFEDDESLRDVVVLRPEWLTKAIGHVLEDVTTRGEKGVLRHERLGEIWHGYPAGDHPYFLRLMERFDVSYRIPDQEASLVGQLVPFERPRLPWDGRPAERRHLTLICAMDESPPGLMPWLIVRTHRFATGLHWRRGVYLRHPDFGAEALLELTRGDRLRLIVRAPLPDAFFSVLRDAVADLIKRRWAGLGYDFLVPCQSIDEHGAGCSGLLPFTGLQGALNKGRNTLDCHVCYSRQDIVRLLVGFDLPTTSAAERLDRIGAAVDEVRSGQRRIEAFAAESAQGIRAVFTMLGHEITDCPRLVTLERTDRRGWFRRMWLDTYAFTLWCEEPGREHPCPDAVYEPDRPRRWLAEALPYLRMVSRILRAAVPVAAAVPGVVLDDDLVKRIDDEIVLLKELTKLLPAGRAAVTGNAESTGFTRAEGAGLRALREMLFEMDKARNFGGLRRVTTISGDLLWVCPDHHQAYDPGLPKLPGGRA